MKISLVVASGVHQGKVIAIPGTQFLIGRDEGCHLRPASPAISKKHCLLAVRDGKAFAQDLGSTNGTFVNDEQIQGERELADGDRLRVGPLDFTVALNPSGKSDSTPLPDALKAVGGGKSDLLKKAVGAADKPTPAASQRPTPAPTHNRARPCYWAWATTTPRPRCPAAARSWTCRPSTARPRARRSQKRRRRTPRPKPRRPPPPAKSSAGTCAGPGESRYTNHS